MQQREKESFLLCPAEAAQCLCEGLPRKTFPVQKVDPYP